MLNKSFSELSELQSLVESFFFLLRIAQMHDIDLNKSLKNKLIINAKKYPIEKSKGSNKKYNE